MKNVLTLTLCAVACLGTGLAQTKHSGTGKCNPKPESQQMLEAGDPGKHVLTLVKSACSWTTPMEIAGAKTKDYTVVVISDGSSTSSQDRGYVTTTMENGDKAFIRFQGTSVLKDGKQTGDQGTWSYTGGTGKLKGIKGKGTYKGTLTADGFEDQVEGDYALPAPKSSK